MKASGPGAAFKPPAWTRIRAGENRVILVVDFPATGRPEASFADLTRHIPTGHGMWEVGLPESDSAAWHAPELLHWWTGDVRRRGLEVTAIMGFCASSSYAMALARELPHIRTRPRIILIDPTTVDREILCEFGFIRVIELFRRLLSSDEFETAVMEARQLCSNQADLRGLVTALKATYLDTASVALAHARISPVQAEELNAVVLRYLDYLRVAGELDASVSAGEATAIRSCDYPGSMNVSDSVSSPVSHDSMLASEWTGRAIASILEATGRP